MQRIFSPQLSLYSTISKPAPSHLPPKKKRGRPPKIRYLIPNEAELLPTNVPGETISELQMAYKPLKEMMGISKLRPLIEKPDELLYGLYDYYDIIEEPMWLLEMSRKFAEKRYNGIGEVMRDMRLVLENCYKFWGKKHKFVKQALTAERILAKHITDYPPEVRSTCYLALYDSEDGLSHEGSESFDSEEYTSKILRNLEMKLVTTKMRATLEEMQNWEEEILEGTALTKQIHVMAELAEIGQFLLMAREILCLKPISQYEIERMLVIARESTTLATIMTSFLCPTAMRPALYLKPIMVYDVWVSLLQKKVDIWYNAYAKYNNRMVVFIRYGIEPSFFDCVGETNPMTVTPFHELSLHQKAGIMKALCSSMFHSNKKIEEYFNVVGESSLKPKLLFSDSKHEYVSLFSPEIRVYRTSKVCLDIDATIESVFPHYFDFYPRVEVPESHPELNVPFSKKQKFCLVANDRESLTSLSKIFAKRKRGRASIIRLLAEEKNRELSLIGLRALHSQWSKAIYKDQVSVAVSQNYWIIKVANSANVNDENVAPENPNTTEKDGNPSEKLGAGKRILKRKYPQDDDGEAFSSNDDKPNEDEISDWEDGNIRRSRRIKKVSGLPRFFDHKYMKFENAGEGDYVYGTSRRKASDEKPAVKKPRKKREKKIVVDGTAADKKVVRRRNSKKSEQSFAYGLDPRSNPLGIVQDEPYLPPLDLPKFVQSAQPSISAQSTSSGHKSDLFDLGTWDFGVQPPLKPVEAPLLVPEEGDKKILELGAVTTPLTPTLTPPLTPMKPIPLSQRVPELHHVKPPKPIAPPRKHQLKPLYPLVQFVSDMPIGGRLNFPVFSGRGREPIQPMQIPGPSRLPDKVVLPWENVTKPRLLPLDPRFLPAGSVVVKTPTPQFRVPVQRTVAPPPPNMFSHFKRKVNLPARPLSIPVIQGQEVSVIQSQLMNSLESSSRVLYIPTGTPTITVPSASGSSEEKMLTVL